MRLKEGLTLRSRSGPADNWGAGVTRAKAGNAGAGLRGYMSSGIKAGSMEGAARIVLFSVLQIALFFCEAL